MKSSNGFYTEDFSYAFDNGNYKAEGTFENKIVVWCAISSAGIWLLYDTREKQPPQFSIHRDVCLNCDIL